MARGRQDCSYVRLRKSHATRCSAVVVAADVHAPAASTLVCAARVQKFFDSHRTLEQAGIRHYSTGIGNFMGICIKTAYVL